jgi:hypothetical protein
MYKCSIVEAASSKQQAAGETCADKAARFTNKNSTLQMQGIPCEAASPRVSRRFDPTSQQ